MTSIRDRGGDCKARGGTVIWLRFASALPDRMAMPDIADLCRYRRRGGLLEERHGRTCENQIGRKAGLHRYS